MTGKVQTMWREFQTMYEENADPRTKDWLFISSPGLVFSIIAGYLYFCTKLGPRLMEDRKPFELKNTLIVYNACQVLLSCYIVCRASFKWWEFGSQFDIFCTPIDYTYSPFGYGLSELCWVYFFAKLTELLDTVFFVLRKKYNQVTFLHLFHHASMPVYTCIGVRYFAGGHITFFGLINSFVHIIMYSYYLLSALGPEFQKYLWWKQHLTGLQLIQFFVIWVQNLMTLYLDCDYPRYLTILMICHAMLFMYLFGKFYVNSYFKGNRNKVDDINSKAKKI